MSSLALCIPAYNAAAFLPRLLSSAQQQAIPFNEIWVYDDCSTDDTAAIAKQFGATVISGEVNRGCSFGKNTLAASVKSDWIHFHDADDDLLPNFTTSVHQWIERNGSQKDILLLNYNYVDAYSGEILGAGNYDALALRNDPLKYAIMRKIVNFGVYRRDKFLNAGGFNTDTRVLYNEDNAMHQRMAKAGLYFDYLPDITCINYRYKVSMSSANYLKCAISNYYVLEDTALTHGAIYPKEIADKLWECVAALGVGEAYDYMEKALAICKKLGYPYSSNGGRVFNALTHLHPFGAVWLREKLIRLFKPHLRSN
ncbi:glycosyltransferase family 2 protein [Mucilaginibacter ximonensis]|uniref:Glycosyltransferase family 2 protein n=1 Tax=Mucilaginibacter ximonensis TaxID=538021 RepID=A0ABW5YDM9_9SPHI